VSPFHHLAPQVPEAVALQLGALVKHAKGRALPALSLSVAPDNHAVRLYKRVGFEEVGLWANR
jgi:ribosomal protein S18 acetylase RimI-like enzyme